MLEISDFLTLHSVCFTRSGLTICKDTNMVTIDNTGNKVLYFIKNLKYNTNPYQYHYYSLDNSFFIFSLFFVVIWACPPPSSAPNNVYYAAVFLMKAFEVNKMHKTQTG